MKKIKIKAEQKLPICVAIPIKNEAENLAQCLPRLTSFNEVWIIDSSSTDQSRRITEAFGFNYINFMWNGAFPKKRNWFLQSNFTQLDWVLFLDADELMTDSFISEVESVLSNTEHNGFWITYTNYFLNKPLNHGVPQRKLALIRNQYAYFEKIEEHHWTSLDMEVHEHPIVQGTVGQLSAKLVHRDQASYDQIYARHLSYAKWEARRYYQIHDKQFDGSNALTLRQQLKYSGLASSYFSKLYFIVHYIILLGFLDKKEGLKYAQLKYRYFKKIYEEIKFLSKNN